MKGRKPKPTALKKLQGTHRPDRANPAEPQFAVPGRVLNVPDYLSGRAADVWRDLGRMLLDAGLFTVVDKYALGMFCAAAGRWMEAEVKLVETGGAVLTTDDGNLTQNPWLWTANKAWEQMRKLFGEFGLTPAERARLQVTDDVDEPTLVEQLFQMAEELDD